MRTPRPLVALAESYAFCEGVAKREAKNFYYSFLLLDRPERSAMCAMYAFMRYCDDLSDSDEVRDRVATLGRWKSDMEAALAGRTPEHLLWPAFTDAVQRYKIPHGYFYDMIAGVSSDLEPREVRTFEDLYAYCYQVASVVGLTVIHIFGFEQPEALKLAEECGIAFQLTNILRDVKEDAEKGRVYLPAEDLARFGVIASELSAGSVSDRLRSLLRFEGARAREYYRKSAPLVEMIRTRNRGSLKALIGVYSRLLDEIEARDYEVLERRVSVPKWEKIWILVKSAI